MFTIRLLFRLYVNLTSHLSICIWTENWLHHLDAVTKHNEQQVHFTPVQYEVKTDLNSTIHSDLLDLLTAGWWSWRHVKLGNSLDCPTFMSWKLLRTMSCCLDFPLCWHYVHLLTPLNVHVNLSTQDFHPSSETLASMAASLPQYFIFKQEERKHDGHKR